MCSGCSGYCCKLHVDLTVYDVLRISELSGKDFDSFVQLYEADETDTFGFRALGQIVKLSLAKKSDGYCTFFGSGPDLCCSIEENKPGICLIYPMALDGNKVVLREDAICPKENIKRADFSKMNSKALEDYGWEWQNYYQFVQEWNNSANGSENPNEFLDYAIRQVKYEMSPLGRFYRSLKKRLFPHKRV